MKVFTGLAAALIVALTALVAPAATAAPYPHTVETTCHARAVDDTIDRDRFPRFRFRIATAGNASPNAQVFITVRRASDGQVLDRTERYYNQDVEFWAFAKRRPGNYLYTFYAVTPPNSVYENCFDVADIRITR